MCVALTCQLCSQSAAPPTYTRGAPAATRLGLSLYTPHACRFITRAAQRLRHHCLPALSFCARLSLSGLSGLFALSLSCLAAEKGDALFATELALSLEKLNFTKLRELHALATRAEDADTTHFIEDHLLHEQVRGGLGRVSTS